MAACLSVSLLDLVLGYLPEDLRGFVLVPDALALGVLRSWPSWSHAASSPESEPLSEEFSLPVPSLSQ